MLLIASGDAVAMPCSRRGEQGEIPAAQSRTSDNATPPCLEDTRPGRWIFAGIASVALLTVAQQFGWLS